MRYSRTAVALLAAVTSVSVLTACGASPTSGNDKDKAGGGTPKVATAAKKVYDELNGLSGDERKQRLVELAEKEGALSVYTSNTDIDDIIDVFEDTYDIDVSVYRANSETVLQRVLQEQRAHFYGNDVLETDGTVLNIANQEKLLYPYESEYRDSVREGGQGDNWTASRFNAFVVGWNTKLVKKGEEPTSVEELADPKWKGKISMELGDIDWYMALTDYWLSEGKSQAEVDDLWSKLAANAKVVKGHTVQGELLSAGQFAVTLSSYSHTIDKAREEDGAPVEWRGPQGPVQPVVLRANGVALMTTAAHPAAAILFADFELTEGQKIFAEAFRVGSETGAEDALAGIQTLPVDDKKFLAESEDLGKKYENVVQGGEQVDG